MGRALLALLSLLTLASSLQIDTYSDRIEASNAFISVNLTSNGEFSYQSKSETLARLNGGSSPLITVKLLQITDNSYYTTTPMPVATIDECRSSTSHFSLETLNWRLSTQTNVVGTATPATSLIAATTYGNNCTFTLKIIVTDVKFSMQVGPSSVIVTPDALKYTYDINCPWDSNIRSGEPPVPGEPTQLWIRNRRSFIYAEVKSFTVSNDSKTYAESVLVPVGYPTFQSWTSNTCTQRDMTTNSTPPLRPLWQNFNFSEQYSVVTEFSGFNLSVDSLAWALSDGNQYTRVSGAPTNFSQTYDGTKYVKTLTLEAQFEFLNRFEYDPTLAIAFLLPEEKAPDGTSSNVTTGDISLSAGIIAIIAVVSIVAGVAVAVAIAAAFVPSFRYKLMPFRARRMEGSDLGDSLEQEDSSNEETNKNIRRESQWVRATRT